MWALEKNEQYYRDDIEETNNMQIDLVIEYYTNKTHNIAYMPNNQDCTFWINNFSQKFREIWESWIHNKETIKRKLYEN